MTVPENFDFVNDQGVFVGGNIHRKISYSSQDNVDTSITDLTDFINGTIDLTCRMHRYLHREKKSEDAIAGFSDQIDINSLSWQMENICKVTKEIF